MDNKSEAGLTDNSEHQTENKVVLNFVSLRGNASEYGSCTGPSEKNDPMKVWLEMKQNGFLSPPACRTAPKKDGRKRKNDVLKYEMPRRKMKVEKDLSKKKMKVENVEQVSRFNKIAAPSGLLDELNPGIINHLRNCKQVHSIIGALVGSEKSENTRSKQANQLKNEIRESDVDECSSTLSGGSQIIGYHTSVSRPMHINSEHRGGVSELSIAARRGEDEDDKHELKSWSAVTMASDHASSNDETVTSESTSSHDESAEKTMFSFLDVQAPAVASQWMEFLCRDIIGRLAALRRSRARIKDVIQIELPFLILKEFSPFKENDQLSTAECPDMHQAKWTALFDQMDNTLYEEMNLLESWLNQVKEMQLHGKYVQHMYSHARHNINSQKCQHVTPGNLED